MRPGLGRWTKVLIVGGAVFAQLLVFGAVAWSFSRARDQMIFEQEGERQAVRAAEQEAAEELATTEKQESARRAEARERNTPRPVALASLIAEYESNEIRADSQFKGRVVRFSGIVTEVSKDFTDHAFLVIATSSGSRSRVRCGLADGANRAAANLQPGSSVTVTGRVSGFVIRQVVLSECALR